MLKGRLKTEYEIVKQLNNSDERIVYLCRNKLTDSKVVIKENAISKEIIPKLLEVNCINLPKTYDIVDEYVVEEFIEGVTLDEWYEAGHTENEISEVIIQLINAVSVLHELGIIHRDIKPENVIVAKDGIPKLIDFSAAREHKDEAEADTTSLGTVGYAAPEQFGIAQSDARTDIYSIGVLLNVLLTGEHPSLKMHSGKYARVIDKCIRVNMSERYKSCEELLQALNKADNSKKSLVSAIAVSGILLTLVVAGIIVLSRNNRATSKMTADSEILTSAEAAEGLKDLEDDSENSGNAINRDVNSQTDVDISGGESASVDEESELADKKDYRYYDWDAIYVEACRRMQEKWPQYIFSYTDDYENKRSKVISYALIDYNDVEHYITEEQRINNEEQLIQHIMTVANTYIEEDTSKREMLGLVMTKQAGLVYFDIIAY